ncbi:MAG: hypothetical protein NUW37_02105 [Planctomycetes bacterium]|nr:hypothetical protein [Planctomycetota bacterium]
MSKSFELKVPLKIILGGEYAVVDLVTPGIGCAIDRYAITRVEPAEKFEFTAVNLGGRKISRTVQQVIDIDGWQEVFDLPREFWNAMIPANLFFGVLRSKGLLTKGVSISLDTSAAFNESSGQKLGLGSSAAQIVATFKSLAGFYSKDAKAFDQFVFVGCFITSFITSDFNSSGIDVAICLREGVVVCDPKTKSGFLGAKSEEDLHAAMATYSAWQMPMNDNVYFPVCFLGESVNSEERVARYKTFAFENPEIAERFAKSSAAAVRALRIALGTGRDADLQNAAGKCRDALAFLDKETDLGIETPEANRFREIAKSFGLEGKTSGSGGGDIAIAMTFDKARAEKFVEELWKEGFYAFVARPSNQIEGKKRKKPF